jgi:hypothetical protein
MIQREVAKKANITQAALSQMEKTDNDLGYPARVNDMKLVDHTQTSILFCSYDTSSVLNCWNFKLQVGRYLYFFYI